MACSDGPASSVGEAVSLIPLIRGVGDMDIGGFMLVFMMVMMAFIMVFMMMVMVKKVMSHSGATIFFPTASIGMEDDRMISLGPRLS